MPSLTWGPIALDDPTREARTVAPHLKSEIYYWRQLRDWVTHIHTQSLRQSVASHRRDPLELWVIELSLLGPKSRWPFTKVWQIAVLRENAYCASHNRNYRFSSTGSTRHIRTESTYFFFFKIMFVYVILWFCILLKILGMLLLIWPGL